MYSRDDAPPEFLLIDGDFVAVEHDLAQYIRHEASRRGIPESDVYKEELDAASEVEQISLSNADLKDLAKRFPAPDEWS